MDRAQDEVRTVEVWGQSNGAGAILREGDKIVDRFDWFDDWEDEFNFCGATDEEITLARECYDEFNGINSSEDKRICDEAAYIFNMVETVVWSRWVGFNGAVIDTIDPENYPDPDVYTGEQAVDRYRSNKTDFSILIERGIVSE